MLGTAQKFGLGRVYRDATAEAKRCGDRRVGTEHLVLALLADPESVTARALGVSLTAAHDALRALDRQALASVGIEADFTGQVLPGREGERLRLTPAAKAVFSGLRKEVTKDERLGIQHVLLALLSRHGPDPAAELLDALTVDRTQARRRVQDLS
jgi:ATP-dependent Clp protease ATP-binding subunit ClpA